MIKQLLALIVFSLAVILCMPYAQHAVELLISAHNWVSTLLTEVFSSDRAGNLVRGLLALLTIPFVIGFIPALVYWLLKRNWFPYFMQVVWIIWLIQVGALIVVYKTVA